MWSLVVAMVFVTPFAMQADSYDVFRTPKDVALLTISLLLITVGTAGSLLSENVAALFRRLPVRPILLALAAAAWTGIVSITSQKPGGSFWAPVTVICFLVFFCAVLLTANRRSPIVTLLVLLIPAIVNAVVATLQSTGIWLPWMVNPKIPLRLRATGFIGNPNDLGSFLVLPALAAFAAGLAWPKHRWLFGVALVFVVGIASAQSVTPFVAAVAGMFIMAMVSNSRRIRLGVLAAALTLLATAFLHPGSRIRFQQLYENLTTGTMQEMTSFRVVPTVTAWDMFRDHPVAGVGPGAFSSLYMKYKLAVDERYPQWVRLVNASFGQVHNDHVQILAETGVPGYALFLGALVLLASVSFRRREATDLRPRFARVIALPAAVSFGVLTLAHFPMQLTAPMVPAIYLSALCFAWIDEGVADESD